MSASVIRHTWDRLSDRRGKFIACRIIAKKIYGLFIEYPISINFRRVTVVLLPILTFVIYLPSLFRYEVVKCVLFADGSITYYKRDNLEFLQTMFYSVSRRFWLEFRESSLNSCRNDSPKTTLNLTRCFLFPSPHFPLGLQSNIGNSL